MDSGQAGDVQVPPHGTTLVELMVVLTIIGIVLGVTAAGFAGLREPAVASARQRLEKGRWIAIRSEAPNIVTGRDSAGVVLFLPDGQAIGPGVDPLTGEVLDEAY